jgi:hypothetical protein
LAAMRFGMKDKRMKTEETEVAGEEKYKEE